MKFVPRHYTMYVVAGAVLVVLLAAVGILSCSRVVPSPNDVSTVEPRPSETDGVDPGGADRDGRAISPGEQEEVLVNYAAVTPAEWSAEDYDELLPLICSTAVHQFKIGAGQFPLVSYYEWVAQIDPELARRPLTHILQGEDVGMITAAAYITGVIEMDDATPLLIDAMQNKQQGRRMDEGSLSQAYFVQCASALGKSASRGDRRALEFLTSHSTADSWSSARLRLLSLDEETSQRYLAGYTVDGLVFCPTEESIAAIERSRSSYKWADERIRLIRRFLESGDTLEEYHKELTTAGLVHNKYLDPPTQ